MTIDHPRQQDLPVLRSLWKEAFGDTDSFLNGFFQTGYAPERCRCLYLQDTPVAVLYWFDCLWEEKKLAYIYAVATDKAFRGRGLCSSLMEDTHRHLRACGYAGAILVPGSEKLFSLYAKHGYKCCCPMKKVNAAPACTAVLLQRVSAKEYEKRRRRLLPRGGVLQEGPILEYLATFTQLLAGENVLVSISREEDTLYFQEFLGDPSALPGVIAGLGGREGVLRLPGGDTPWAMYLPLDGTQALPSYFGISLG